MSLCTTLHKKTCQNLLALVATGLFGCTQAVPHQQELSNQERSNDAVFTVKKLVVDKQSKPVDILWVIDNSASMQSSQEKLRAGLAGFAKQYLLREGTDIQMGVIATDAFAANEAWEKWRATLPKTIKSGDKIVPITIGPNSAKLKSVMRTRGAGGKSLISRFESQVVQGTAGVYEEHGFDSVTQFLADNEKDGSKTKLFRPNSQRIVVFVTDEDDQSLDSVGPDGPGRKLLYTGSYYTGTDPKQAAAILPPHFSIDCPATKVDGVDLEPMTICADASKLLPVSEFKTGLDAYFRKLDGGNDPKYMVVAIVAKDVATIQDLRARSTENGKKVITHEQGRRYLELVSMVPGSLAMDIGAKDYAPILNQIGLEIENRSVVDENTAQVRFELPYEIDRTKPTSVTVERGAERFEIAEGQYAIEANILRIVDPKLISTLKPGDRIRVRYRPANQLPVLKK